MHSLAIFVWLLLVVEPGFGANLRKPRESADHSWFQQYMDIIIDPFNPGAPKTQELDWFMRESNETDSEWPPKISLRDLLYYDADESDRKVIRASNLTDDYYSVNQIYEWLNHVHSEHKEATELIEIGQSVLEQRILVLKIGFEKRARSSSRRNPKKKAFWFDSGIHAREWTTISASMYMIDKILRDYRKNDSVIHRLLTHFDLYFLVCFNPDGYEYSLKVNPEWRKNMKAFKTEQLFQRSHCFGVDLNRNFDAAWKMEKKKCHQVYSGERGNSEPETQAVVNFLTSEKHRWLSYISLHSYGGLWLYWNETNHINRQDYVQVCKKPLLAIRGIQSRFNLTYKFGRPVTLLGYTGSGTSNGWASSVLGIKHSYAVEIGPTDQQQQQDPAHSYGFSVQHDKIRPLVRVVYHGLLQYMRSFMDSMTDEASREIERTCELEYENDMDNTLATEGLTGN